MHLLDINILIALGDPTHVHHSRVRAWFLSSDRQAWATCPLTENGFIRIIGHPGYSGFTGGVGDARDALQALTSAPGHQFWPDDLTLIDQSLFPVLTTSRHLTDLYLLALAIHRGGRFATLDERINAALIPRGSTGYFIVPKEG